jgi:hypothetical protein
VRISLALKAPLHLFFQYPNHPLCLPVEVLPYGGHQMPLYSFPSRPSQDTIKVPGGLKAATSYLPLADRILKNVALTHMNLLSAIKKPSVEFDSANSTWIAEVAVQMKTTPLSLDQSPFYPCDAASLLGIIINQLFSPVSVTLKCWTLAAQLIVQQLPAYRKD